MGLIAERDRHGEIRRRVAEPRFDEVDLDSCESLTFGYGLRAVNERWTVGIVAFCCITRRDI